MTWYMAGLTALGAAFTGAGAGYALARWVVRLVRKWRVRRAVVRQLRRLGRELGP